MTLAAPPHADSFPPGTVDEDLNAITDWVTQALEAEWTDAQIAESMKGAGWDDADVQECLRHCR
jgi:hypothetical protein